MTTAPAPDDEDVNLSTKQAADLAGMNPGQFRAHASQQRAKGNEMRAARDEWPDGRTPRWDEDKVKAWIKTRENEMARTTQQPRQLVDMTLTTFHGGLTTVSFKGRVYEVDLDGIDVETVVREYVDKTTQEMGYRIDWESRAYGGAQWIRTRSDEIVGWEVSGEFPVTPDAELMRAYNEREREAAAAARERRIDALAAVVGNSAPDASDWDIAAAIDDAGYRKVDK